MHIRTGKSSLADIEALAGRLWRASISTSGRAIKHAIPDVLENYLESLAAQCVEERRIKRVGAEAAIGQTRRERGEEKGKWRRRESSQKEDFDNIVEMEEEMVEVRKVAVEEKQMMDDVAILMRKVADALAEFAMDQSVDNLRSLGLEE